MLSGGFMMETFISFLPELSQALQETFAMLVIGLFFAIVFGGLIGTSLFLWSQCNGTKYRALYLVVGGMVNIVRSFPFVILMIAVTPMSRVLTGSSIGPLAASVPLSISAIAYFARLVELALNEVPKGVIEAAHSMGASTPRIIFSVLYVEARSSLILGLTALAISFLSYTAAAGIVGGGGIGDLAIRYGYYRFQTEVMIITVVGLVLFVQLIQWFGNLMASRLNQH
jgi:D-methionine transport system permease protein